MCIKTKGQLVQAAVKAATTIITIGGQTLYSSFQLAKIAIPNTISESIKTHAQKLGAQANREISLSIPTILLGPITNSFNNPGINITSPRRTLFTVAIFL